MNRFNNLADTLKRVAKKLKAVTLTITTLILLLMNGQISNSNLVYGKYEYIKDKHSN